MKGRKSEGSERGGVEELPGYFQLPSFSSVASLLSQLLLPPLLSLSLDVAL